MFFQFRPAWNTHKHIYIYVYFRNTLLSPLHTHSLSLSLSLSHTHTHTHFAQSLPLPHHLSFFLNFPFSFILILWTWFFSFQKVICLLFHALFLPHKLTASLLNISYLSSAFISSDILLSAYSGCVRTARSLSVLYSLNTAVCKRKNQVTASQPSWLELVLNFIAS